MKIAIAPVPTRVVRLCILLTVLLLWRGQNDAAQQPADRIQFTDVARQAQFSYISNNNYTGRKYFPQPMCGGVALLDYNNDGQARHFLHQRRQTAGTEKNRLLLSTIASSRTRATVFSSTSLTVQGMHRCRPRFLLTESQPGDYDNDGFTDLFICNAGRNALYHNNGDGTFSDVTREAGLDDKPPDLLSVCAAWFDYDNDGRLDLVVSQYTNWNPTTDRRCVRRGKVDYYCSPRTVTPRAALALPQRGKRQIPERDGERPGSRSPWEKGWGLGSRTSTGTA